MIISAANIGSRMVVRHVVAGRGPSGGPAMSDVVGRILAVAADAVTVERRDGSVVRIAAARVVTAKVVPAVPTRSRGALAISSANLAAVMARGWVPARAGSGALVQVAMLRSSYPPAGVRTEATATAAWRRLYAEAGDGELRGGPATVGFQSLGDPVAAIGRVAVTGEWAGLSCLYVTPDRRRQGLGTRIVEAAISWARGQGADKAYVQVPPDNEAALGMLAPFGFRTHIPH